MAFDAYCIYHSSDFDGKCSAAIVKKFNAEKGINTILLPIDYNEDFNIQQSIPGENKTVYIVDFSFDPAIMRDIYYTHDLIWIDHHDFSIIESKDTPYQYCDGLRSTECSACQLTWLYLYNDIKSEMNNNIKITEEVINQIPLAVNLLGWYDTNQIKSHKNIMAFQFGMTVMNNSFKNTLWDALLTTNIKTINSIINKGRVIYAYMTRTVRDNIHKLFYDITFEGLKAIVVNSSPYFPRTLIVKEIFDETRYDICIIFYKISVGWKVSLITTNPKLNMGQLAKKFKGGGHTKIGTFKIRDISMIINGPNMNNNKQHNKSNNSKPKNNNQSNNPNKQYNPDNNLKKFSSNQYNPNQNTTTIRQFNKSHKLNSEQQPSFAKLTTS